MPFAPVVGGWAALDVADELGAAVALDAGDGVPEFLFPLAWIVGAGFAGTVKCFSFSGADFDFCGASWTLPAFSEVASGLMVPPTQVPLAVNGRSNLMSKCSVYLFAAPQK
jgi:hypothetical protein